MTLSKRSLTLHGHRTSVALEPEFWAIIEKLAHRDNSSLAGLLTRLDDKRIAEKSPRGLAAYLRVWVLNAVIEGGI
jgi:predicted DNA-binding ribbon-helix-helix protein